MTRFFVQEHIVHSEVVPFERSIENRAHFLLRIQQILELFVRRVTSIFRLILLNNEAQILFVLKVDFPTSQAAFTQFKF
jgi:hypothetical protein